MQPRAGQGEEREPGDALPRVAARDVTELVRRREQHLAPRHLRCEQRVPEDHPRRRAGADRLRVDGTSSLARLAHLDLDLVEADSSAEPLDLGCERPILERSQPRGEQARDRRGRTRPRARRKRPRARATRGGRAAARRRRSRPRRAPRARARRASSTTGRSGTAGSRARRRRSGAATSGRRGASAGRRPRASRRRAPRGAPPEREAGQADGA